MNGPLTELGLQLLTAAEQELLDMSLDALGDRVNVEEARALFLALHESGEADTLRDACTGGVLERWVEKACTSSEERALTLQLRRWLGQEASSGGPDDPTRLVRLDVMPPDPESLVIWARRYDVVGELMRPAAEVLANVPTHGTELSVLEACCPDFAAVSGVTLSTLRWLEPRARAYLLAQAAETRALAAREALWQSAWPQGKAPLRALGERLRALIPASAPGSLHGLRFVAGRPVALDAKTGVCRGILHGEENSFLVRIWLSGYEQRALDSRCELCDTARCLHVAALAGRLLDACLEHEDSLRGVLQELVQVPSWQRFVDALGGGSETEREREATTLSFSIRLEGGRVSVGVFKQSARGRPNSESNKLASPLRLLRGGGLDERDRAVLEALAARTRTLGAQFVNADLAVLRSLVEHPHVQGETDGQALRVSEEQLEVTLLEVPEGLTPQVTLAGMRITASAQDAFALCHDGTRHSLVFAALPQGIQRLLSALEHFRGVLPKESYPAIAAKFSSLSTVARVAVPKQLTGYEYPAPEKLLMRMSPRLDEGIEVALCVRVFPLSPLWIPGEGKERVEGLVDGVKRFSRRTLTRERELVARVVDTLALTQHTAIARYVYLVDSHAAALEVLSRAAQLHEALELEWAETARQLRVTQTVRTTDLHIRLFKRGTWLQLSGSAKSGEGEIAIARLLDAVRRGERFVSVTGHDYAEIEQSLFTLLQDAQLSVSRQDQQLALALAAAPRLLAQLGPQTEPADADTRAWLDRAQQREPLEIRELPLQDRLRGYQQDGVRWLMQLATWAPGACLADDMGLGKTIQAIALLVQRRAAGPALVVAPTSLVSNWQSELERFAPELRALVYRGPERARLLDELGPSAVLITSYEILLRDSEQLRAHAFGTHIVDEAQTIRNARTRRAQAVADIRAEFRVALTGTPIENRLGDLWSLFSFITPGLLGNWARFRALFAVPIERYDERDRATRLRSLVAPFLLRRTKDQVAPELPARTEVVHAVELSEAEQQLYRSALMQARDALGKRSKKKEQTFSVHILAELTRLRQLACHPRLVLDDSRIESSKLHALTSLLDDILPRGHRVLVFSQFTKHLGLVREALDARGVSSLYLDGSTPGSERAQLIDDFQTGSAEVFLISLKAGGTGLNLTAADYVIHLDPWWNPAAEDQASDRAHRIGQVKPVTIVKLVSQGTIEERVLGLHEHKRRLAFDMLSSDDTVRPFDRDALEALLSE